MPVLLPDGPVLAAFLAASLLLAITPGPGVLYILARSIAQGRSAGLASVAGVALGNLANATGASLGLAALFAMSSMAFLLVKYAGAGYLVYLGVRALRAPGPAALPAPGPAPRVRIFRDGFLVALLNPKTALFFAAFLPQFMGAQPVSAATGILLGAMFVGVAACTDALYALAGGLLSAGMRGWQGAGRAGRYLGGCTFIGLGLLTAATGHRTPR